MFYTFFKSIVCDSHVPLCHPCMTGMYSYVIHMPLVYHSYTPDVNDFKVMGSKFRKNVAEAFKIAGVLLIRQLKPTLSKQEKLTELTLFN